MSVRFTLDGVAFECGDAEEAAALFHLLVRDSTSDIKRSNGHSANGKKKATKLPNYEAFVESLDEEGRSVMRVLKRTASPVTTADLSEKSGVDRKRLRVVSKSVRAAAARYGLNQDDAFKVTRIRVGRNLQSTYETQLTNLDL